MISILDMHYVQPRSNKLPWEYRAEPTLRELVLKYYTAHFPWLEAEKLANNYCSFLEHCENPIL
jgi:hypothetical protein